MMNMFGNISNSFEYLRYKIGGSKGDFTFLAPGDIRLAVPRRMLSTFKEMFFRSPYTEGLPKGLLTKENPIVIDIGANVGFFSFYVLSKHPKAKVFAFEPFPPNFELLQHYAAQHAQFDFHPIQMAVASQTGVLSFRYDASDPYSTSAGVDRDEYKELMEVPATTLTQFVEDNQIKQIDWLKIDCEGAEYQIFESLPDEVLNLVQILTVETHDSDVKGRDNASLAKHIASKGFKVKTNQISPLIWAWR